MSMSQPFALTAAAAVAAGILAGCSGTGSISPVVPASHGVRQAISLDGSVVAPQYLESIHLGEAEPQARPNAGSNLLAVTDFGHNATEILNGSYDLVQRIRGGMNDPDGDWYDQSGNLYVANWRGVNVQEYAPGRSTPTFTYSTGLTNPINVTTDEPGNVYVVDGRGGFVSEFPQGSNTPTFTCPVHGGPEGVVVTEHGKVFVDLNKAGSGVVEFPAGLGNCRSEITLGAVLNSVGGMQIDSHHNLVICDQLSQTVDIVAPPYTIVTRVISNSSFSDPFHVALNRSNTLMFVADPGNYKVEVLKYPSGILVTTLGRANGLSIPEGVATNPFQH